ncbi:MULTISPECIES: outer membrane beta-barrel protein [Neisseria]|nr:MULTISPECIES: outer membrane beta-barrel protein [Neisseria]QCL69682.1 hypothetical protein FAH67_09870 [Neisseria flavescens]SPY01281.1 outer membrane protein [Neisseria meningitidis]SPY06493.1 outer membrane protein [Neisseria meningitidis]STZ66261.1 outer membrane protein [Neisseria flavescens]
MKKFILLAILSLTALTSYSANLSIDYTGWNAKAPEVNSKADLRGISLEYLGNSDSSPAKGWYVRTQYSTGKVTESMVNGKIKMTELEGGYKYPIIEGKSAYLSGKAGIGFAYTTVKANAVSDSVSHITFPFGLEAGIKANSKLTVAANAGYKFGWELSGGSTCRDGWNSPSQGKGSCSHHGGVAETHEEKIGKVRGATFGLGLKYSFD